MKRIYQKFIQKKTTKKDVMDQVKKLRLNLKKNNPESFEALEKQAKIFHENQSQPDHQAASSSPAGEEKLDPQKNISTVLKMLEQEQYANKSPEFKAEIFKIIHKKTNS